MKNYTKEEQIKNIKMALFLLNMKDTWNGADYQRERELEKELAELKKEG